MSEPRSPSSAAACRRARPDAALLVVALFLLAVTLAVHRGLELELRRGAVPDPTARGHGDPVLLEVLPDGRVRVDRETVVVEGLLGYLLPILERAPDRQVIVRPDPDSRYGHTVSVLDELRRVRERLGLEAELNVLLPTECQRAADRRP